MAKIHGNRDKKTQKKKKSWPLDNRKSIRLVAELSIKPKKKRKK